MASSYFWKLRALLKKNIILMKRNIISTLFEIFFPSVIIAVLVVLKEAFSVDTFYFAQEGGIEKFIEEKSMSSFNYNNYASLNKKWNGLSALPPFQICSSSNPQGQERPIIAYVGDLPDKIKDQMIHDSSLTKDSINFELKSDYSNFKKYNSIKEMEEFIKSAKYLLDPTKFICFGIKFSHDSDTGKYDYSLHFFDYEKSGKEGVEDIPNNKEGMFDPFQSGPDLNAFSKYKNGAYSYMMKIVNQYILREELGNQNAELNYGIVAMQYIDYRVDNFGQFMGYMIGVMIVLAYMCPLSLYIYRMVGDKESKIKEGMKIMGLEEGQYFLAYFIQFTVINLFCSLLNAGIFKGLLNYIPYHYLFILMFLWSLNLFALIFFFQSFIDKTKIALVLSLVLYFMMYCVSVACMFDDGSLKSKIVKMILSIFPQVCLSNATLLMSKFQYHFRYFKERDFLRTYTSFSIGKMVLMFVIDFLFFLFLGYFLHNVLPHDFGIRRPVYFLCTSDFWCSNRKKKKRDVEKKLEEKTKQDYVIYNAKESHSDVEGEEDNNLYGNSTNFESEEIYKDKTKKDDVLRVRNIVKIFGDGKMAVNKVNLNFYKDEIFALLGHNGAGKTTLISMLTGLYEATEGKAIYDDENILESSNMNKFREKLGICPQHDILFEDLNIREHLEMFSIFKGVQSDDVDNEVDKVLHDFQLDDIQYMIAKNLSAGNRRKLSIAISLIGGSKVIFLDEPSSGMDITSRRNLWEILKRQCEGKIIILTTHYMEEASVLGKRIGIINAGQMKCIGSPLFLIEKYGKYMSLNITKEENADSDKIIDFVKNLADGVEYEALSEEIMFRVPIKDENNGKNKKVDLKTFFQIFDQNIKKLDIKSYSASMPTLEDVFLNVAAEDNKKTKEDKDEELIVEQENDEILYNSNLREDYTKKSKFINDFMICTKRRYLITKRDLKGFLMEILCPIVLVLFGLAISKIEMGYDSHPEDMDITQMGNQKILYSKINSINVGNYFITDIDKVKSEEIEFTPSNIGDKQRIIKEFVETVYNIEKDTEDCSKHEVDMTSDNYVGYFSSLLMLEEDNTNKKYEFVMALNARVAHGIPIYSHYLLKQIIKSSTGRDIDIHYTHYPLPMTHDLSEQSSFGNSISVIFFMAIALALMPANFITTYVKERVNNSKHLMRISGINIFSYWIVNYIFELVKYYFATGICLLLLFAFDYYENYLYIFYITFGPGMISLTYSLSFFFDNESNAQNAVILINFLFGYLGSIIVGVLRGMKSAALPAKVIEYIFAFVPTFCFEFSFNLLINPIGIYMVDYPDEWFFFKDDVVIKKFNLLLSMIIYSSAECVVYALLLVFIESRTYAFSKPTNKMIKSEINDSEVVKEIERVNFSYPDMFSSSERNNILIDGNEKNNQKKDYDEKEKIKKENEYSVRIKNLKKIYTNGCCSSPKDNIIAIKNLNFGIKPGECFGLLGLNGAGKTTTFKCITQELAQNNGTIYVNGKNIMGRFDELNELFGYCPQFDAIFELLSVYENLEFYARIKGIREDSISMLVNAMIKEMSLDEFTNKIAGRLSGGNKRKLAVAISMLCSPPIILLDEPSTGMDPEARRFMWSVIHKMSTKGRKSSVIMTTHSMDEAETLCKRMGIMVNGEFVCLGKANQIKDKYGFGYEADVRIKPMTENQKDEIYAMHNWDKKLLVTEKNIEEILQILGKSNFYEELKEGRLGERINRELKLNGNIPINTLLNWIFFVENALKFIQTGKQYFDEIILSEHIENNFLFKMKKEHSDKSIGFFFGLFDESKEKYFVTEYSIQQTSLEQIFNKFAANQGKTKKQLEEKKNEDDQDQKKNIIIDDILISKLAN